MFQPSLPPDNLYKFFAIAGITLIIFSFYTINENSKYNLNDLEKELSFEKKETETLTEISKKKEILTQKLRDLNFYIDNINKFDNLTLPKELNNRQAYLRFTYVDTTIDLRKKRIGIALDELEPLLYLLSDTTKKNTNLKEQNTKKHNSNTYASNATEWITLIVGIVFYFYGFKNWIKQQKLIDEMLEIDHKLKLKSITKTP
jgi:hypothetical protein